MVAVAAGDPVAGEPGLLAVGDELDHRLALEEAGRVHVAGLEDDGDVLVLEHRVVEVAGQFGLAVDHHLLAAGEARQVDPFDALVHREHDAVVQQTLAVHARADAGLAHQVDHPLLEDAGADACLDVGAVLPLEDHALDSGETEQPRQAQARGPAADDADLGLHGVLSPVVSGCRARLAPLPAL